MTTYHYPAMLAVDPNTPGNVVANGVGKVYAITDTAFATPLVTKDNNGVVLTDVKSNPMGLIEQFNVEDNGEVIWVSGGIPIYLNSPLSMVTAAQAAQAAAEAASASAVAALEEIRQRTTPIIVIGPNDPWPTTAPEGAVIVRLEQ